MKSKVNFALKTFLAGVGTAVVLNAVPNFLLENESKLVEQEFKHQKIRMDSEERITKEKIYRGIKRDLEGNSLENLANNLENYPNITFKILKENWIKNITKNPNLRFGLEESIRRAEDYIPSIKHEFIEKNVPQKYVFLGIIESEWTNTTSKKGAKGVFQQTSSTAKDFGAIINSNYDERLNPLFAAQKTANILDYLQKNFGDWDLALAAYNSGGLPWGYLSEVKRSEEDTASLEGYLRFLGRKIKDNSKNKKLLANIDENLGFLKKNAGLFEVLENRYPEIFNLEPSKDTRKVYEISNTPFQYNVKPGDSLWRVAEAFVGERYGVHNQRVTNRTFKWIRNNSDYSKILHPGQEISFLPPNTLSEIEHQTGTNLKKENPHIKNYQAQLPNGAKILLNKY